MVTPFREEDHALDVDGAQRLASHLLDTGSDAIVVAGSTGESPTLSYKEKAELFRAVGEVIARPRQADLRHRARTRRPRRSS